MFGRKKRTIRYDSRRHNVHLNKGRFKRAALNDSLWSAESFLVSFMISCSCMYGMYPWERRALENVDKRRCHASLCPHGKTNPTPIEGFSSVLGCREATNRSRRFRQSVTLARLCQVNQVRTPHQSPPICHLSLLHCVQCKLIFFPRSSPRNICSGSDDILRNRNRKRTATDS
jgi:hypothetical protein